MDKLIVTPDDLGFIATWFEKHQDELPPYPPKAKSELKVQIKANVNHAIEHIYSFTIKNTKDSIYKIKMYRSHGGLDCECVVEYNTNRNRDRKDTPRDVVSLLMNFCLDQSLFAGFGDYRIISESYSGKKTDLAQEKVRTTITLYYYIACFFVYFKPEVIQKVTDQTKKRKPYTDRFKSSGDKFREKSGDQTEQVIVFREYVTALEHGKVCHKHHNPFNHAFTVRGHWRRYKRDGHRTWVEEFQKGTGEKKDKTYRFAKRKTL
jgi:hypothetical protein